MKANRESLLDITVAAASVQISVGDGPQDVDPLLLKAINDTNPTLTETNLFALEGDALQGAVNTAKGKYFEYLVVGEAEPGPAGGTVVVGTRTAGRAGRSSMTQPGWDLRIVDEHGAAVEYLQLKATAAWPRFTHSALRKRYPYIQVLATGEVADSGLVLDSGITDQELRAHVEVGVDAVDVSLTENFLVPFPPPALPVGCHGHV